MYDANDKRVYDRHFSPRFDTCMSLGIEFKFRGMRYAGQFGVVELLDELKVLQDEAGTGIGVGESIDPDGGDDIQMTINDVRYLDVHERGGIVSGPRIAKVRFIGHWDRLVAALKDEAAARKEARRQEDAARQYERDEKEWLARGGSRPPPTPPPPSTPLRSIARRGVGIEEAYTAIEAVSPIKKSLMAVDDDEFFYDNPPYGASSPPPPPPPASPPPPPPPVPPRRVPHVYRRDRPRPPSPSFTP